jgi:hypothetical protein
MCENQKSKKEIEKKKRQQPGRVAGKSITSHTFFTGVSVVPYNQQLLR